MGGLGISDYVWVGILVEREKYVGSVECVSCCPEYSQPASSTAHLLNLYQWELLHLTSRVEASTTGWNQPHRPGRSDHQYAVSKDRCAWEYWTDGWLVPWTGNFRRWSGRGQYGLDTLCWLRTFPQSIRLIHSSKSAIPWHWNKKAQCQPRSASSTCRLGSSVVSQKATPRVGHIFAHASHFNRRPLLGLLPLLRARWRNRTSFLLTPSPFFVMLMTASPDHGGTNGLWEYCQREWDLDDPPSPTYPYGVGADWVCAVVPKSCVEMGARYVVYLFIKLWNC